MAFSQSTADQICDRIAEGEPLRQICRDEGMPNWRTVYLWMEQNVDFAALIARARVTGFDAIAQDILRIADTPLEGIETTEEATTVTAVGEEGEISMQPATLTKTKRADMLGHRKLQIETRLKLLSKWDPKRYGDRLELGGDPTSPLTVVVKRLTDA